jgi:hypothetical protein
VGRQRPSTAPAMTDNDGDMSMQQSEDPAPNVKSIPAGSVLGVSVSMAGPQCRGRDSAGHHRSTRDLLRQSSDVPRALRRSYWLCNSQLSPTPGRVDRFHLCQWGAGPERDGNRPIRRPGSIQRTRGWSAHLRAARHGIVLPLAIARANHAQLSILFSIRIGAV